MIYAVFSGIWAAILISFSDSFSSRILKFFYTPLRKTTPSPWKTILLSRSACDSCGAPVSPLTLIPVFGFFLARGKCSQCGTSISSRYPLEEAFAFLYGVALFFSTNNFLQTLLILLYLPAALTAARTDFRFYLIPTEAIAWTLSIALIELLFFSPTEEWLYSLSAAFLWYALLHLLRILSRDRLGIADIRLTFALALAIGFPGSLFFPTVAAGLGIAFHLVLARKKKKVPFGIYLYSGFFIMKLIPNEVIQVFLVKGSL